MSLSASVTTESTTSDRPPAKPHDMEWRREQYEQYIRQSQGTQRQLWLLSAFGALGSMVAWAFDGRIGLIALVITLFVAFIGFYITGMHIAEWRHELYKMRQQARKQRRAAKTSG